MRKEYCPRYEALNNVVVIWNKSLDKPFKEIGKMGYSFCRINHDGSIMVWIHSDRTNRIFNWFINIPLGPITERPHVGGFSAILYYRLLYYRPFLHHLSIRRLLLPSFSRFQKIRNWLLRERLLFHFNTFTHAWFVR